MPQYFHFQLHLSHEEHYPPKQVKFSNYITYDDNCGQNAFKIDHQKDKQSTLHESK